MDIKELLAEKKSNKVHIINSGSSLLTASQHMIVNHIGCLVVLNEAQKIVGILSERDLIWAITMYDSRLSERIVDDVMSQHVITCSASDNVVEILDLMKKNKIRHIPVLDDGKLAGMVGIRDLIHAYEVVKLQADTDSLTGLANRRVFLSALDTEIDRARRYSRPLTVAMLDIDHFKQFNDTYGHDIGDKVLQILARLLLKELRTIDIIGRIGGEEFALIFPETAMDGARTVCERLFEAIRATTLKVRGDRVAFTISLGLTLVNPVMDNTQEVMKRADILLYQAKAEGRDCFRSDAIIDMPQKTCAG